ncbi:MFS general substrate transporter [Fomes fomentarius]|nr:MFS general substrate transporter [Fomes fomentarius]
METFSLSGNQNLKDNATSASAPRLPTNATADQIRHRADPIRVQSVKDSDTIELTAIRKNAVAAASTALVADVETGAGSRAASIHSNEGNETTADAGRTTEQRRKSLIHFAALCWCLLVNGWNDATTGPMIPRVQERYGVGFAIVSMLFVCNAIGFLSGAFTNVYLTERFGFGKLTTGAACQIGAYVMLIPAGPFPVMCVAYLIIGFTLAIQAAQATGFVASLKKNSNEKMGFLHGTYGLGALISPLAATQFAQDPKHWSFHFIISAGLYAVSTAILWAVFRGRRQDEIMQEEGESLDAENDTGSSKFSQMMRLKEVHFLSFFALIYVGIEVTLGGWIVTFILEKRGGSANSGYISSGFFGGIMLGRILLLWVNRKIGERRALFIYAVLTIGLEITVWLVPSLVQNAIAVSLVGLLLGPMFPILMNHSTTILPRWLMTGCAGYIAGAGQAGSAVLPFITGLLAQKFGIASLQPFVVSMMSTLIILWAVIPRARYVPT